MKNSNIASDIA
jgi:hypothetical protein